MVRADIHSTDDRGIGSKVLLDGTPESILDGRAALDDASDRDGSSIGRLPEGCSDERTRCAGAIPAGAAARECNGVDRAWFVKGSKEKVVEPLAGLALI